MIFNKITQNCCISMVQNRTSLTGRTRPEILRLVVRWEIPLIKKSRDPLSLLCYVPYQITKAFEDSVNKYMCEKKEYRK